MLLAKPALYFPDGPWITLLEKAYSLFDSIASDGFTIPRWSLGGGTVLMFHYAHRRSKDIDILNRAKLLKLDLLKLALER